MSLNRLDAPAIEIPEKIAIPGLEPLLLTNQIPCFTFHSPNQDVVKVELVFNAGNYFEPKRLTAGATNDLSDDGTQHHTARAIAEHFDFYGSSIQLENSPDKASITLFTLGRFLKETLPLIMEIVHEPTFPQEELKTYITQHSQKLTVSNKKVDFVARKRFAEQLYGSQHPYGYYASEQDYFNLQQQDLLDFHRRAYQQGPAAVFVSGNISKAVRHEIEAIVGKTSVGKIKNIEPLDATSEVENSSTFYEERPDALQSAIRIGRKMFNKTNPDFTGMSVLNTLLGGYFGSRLMSNIREDKGYTYGIGSGLISLQKSGYFFITTEVGVGVTLDTLREIYHELDRLIEEPVGMEELKIVKNYLSGVFLRSIDGPFALADKWKNVYFYNLGYEYYEQYLETLRNITPGTLQQLASKYLKKSDLIEVVVGKK